MIKRNVLKGTFQRHASGWGEGAGAGKVTAHQPVACSEGREEDAGGAGGLNWTEFWGREPFHPSNQAKSIQGSLGRGCRMGVATS